MLSQTLSTIGRKPAPKKPAPKPRTVRYDPKLDPGYEIVPDFNRFDPLWLARKAAREERASRIVPVTVAGRRYQITFDRTPTPDDVTDARIARLRRENPRQYLIWRQAGEDATQAKRRGDVAAYNAAVALKGAALNDRLALRPSGQGRPSPGRSPDRAPSYLPRSEPGPVLDPTPDDLTSDFELPTQTQARVAATAGTLKGHTAVGANAPRRSRLPAITSSRAETVFTPPPKPIAGPPVGTPQRRFSPVGALQDAFERSREEEAERGRQAAVREERARKARMRTPARVVPIAANGKLYPTWFAHEPTAGERRAKAAEYLRRDNPNALPGLAQAQEDVKNATLRRDAARTPEEFHRASVELGQAYGQRMAALSGRAAAQDDPGVDLDGQPREGGFLDYLEAGFQGLSAIGDSLTESLMPSSPEEKARRKARWLRAVETTAAQGERDGRTEEARRFRERSAPDPATERLNAVIGAKGFTGGLATQAMVATMRAHGVSDRQTLAQLGSKEWKSLAGKDATAALPLIFAPGVGPLGLMDTAGGYARSVGEHGFLKGTERFGAGIVQGMNFLEPGLDPWERAARFGNVALMGHSAVKGVKRADQAIKGAGRESIPGRSGSPTRWGFVRRTKGSLDDSQIVSPIDPTLPHAEKVQALVKMSRENAPLLQSIADTIDKTAGTSSEINLKSADSIAKKSTRPSIRKTKPWFDVEHLRDGLRFRTVVDHLDDIPKAIKALREQGVTVVKADARMMFEPKTWGWRAVVLDARMPNGQLIEWYLPLKEVFDTNEAVAHKIFEKWRNATPDEIAAHLAEYKSDLDRSNRLLQESYETALARAGLDESAARTRLGSIEASFTSRVRNGRLPPQRPRF